VYSPALLANDRFLAVTLLPGFFFWLTLFDGVLNLPSRLVAGLSPFVFWEKAGIARLMINKIPMILRTAENARILLLFRGFKK
jgi:hypothetical protein